jgi:uncharacterized repeat protein (TIGR01451 family)
MLNVRYAALAALMFVASVDAAPKATNALVNPGEVVISEFRERGPNGASDEYIELYNKTDVAITVGAADGSAGWALASSDGVVRFVVPNGTVLPARGHYLGVNSVGYGLTSYATADITFTADIPDNSGLALFNSAVTLTAANVLDAVGFTTSSAIYREGTGLATLTAFSIDASFYRDLRSGYSIDSGNNATDFRWVDTNGTFNGGQQNLGAPGPENLASPLHISTGTLGSTRLDPSVSVGAAPNFVFNATSDPGNNSTFGTITLRRTLTNNTGAPITRLRFRVVDITTFPSPPGVSDLRPRTSVGGTVAIGGSNPACPANSCAVQVTTLNEPPSQPNGGGFNSTVTANSVTPGAPLLANASINVDFRAGIEQSGCYRYVVIVEAFPAGVSTTLSYVGSAGTAGACPGDPPTTEFPKSTTTSIVSSLNPSIFGQSVTFTASVLTTDAAPQAVSVGTVNFLDNAVAIATCQNVALNGSGQAICTTSTLATGDHPISAQYSGVPTMPQYYASSGTLTGDPQVVNPATPPTPTITPGGATTFCAGGSVTLSSSSAVGNQWYLNGNPIGGATNQTYVATASGAYTVVVTIAALSSAPSAATTVTVNPIPATPTITPGGPTTFAAGGSVSLTSSSASGNQWYLNGNPIGGANAQSYAATASGDYSVIVTNSGCASAASAPTTVTVVPIPATPTISAGGATTFCEGGSVTLTSSSATGNQWYLNGNPIGAATNQSYSATASGDYTVIVSNGPASSAPSAATTVTVNPIPATPTITPGGPTSFPFGGSVTLSSSSATGNQWYLDGNPVGAATSQTYVATTSGTYSVIVTNSGCSSAASASINVTATPTADLSITKTDGATSTLPGSAITYSIVAGNAGPSPAPGSIVVDTFPADLTCTWTCAGTAGGICTSAGSGNINDSADLPSGASVIYSAECTLSATATGILSNTATISAAAGITDPDTTNNSATDDDTIIRGSTLTATKSVSPSGGGFVPGGMIFYTIDISNMGPGVQNDNATDEFSDVLPLGVAYISVVPSSGTATYTAADRTVHWNGSIAAAGSVSIVITVSIDLNVRGRIVNQGTAYEDSNGDGTNDIPVLTDDPGITGSANPTAFQLISEIPTLSAWGLMLMAIGMIAAVTLRRRFN